MNKISLRLELYFENEKKAENIFLALQPELGEKHEKRSTTAIKVKKNMLLIDIKASDRTAARASLHGFMKLIITASDLHEIGGN